MHGLQAPWSQVTSARGLAETGSREGGEAAENYPDLLNHEWHHSRGTSARSADCVHNPGVTKLPVAIGMRFALFVLLVSLQRVVEFPQPPRNGVLTDGMPLART